MGGSGGSVIEILCRSEDGTLLLEVLGDLGSSAAPLLVSCADAAIDGEATTLVIDLRQASVVDPSIPMALRAASARFLDRGVTLAVLGTPGAMAEEPCPSRAARPPTRRSSGCPTCM
jgi:anti-anti-sigma regulatory factor